MEEEEEVICCSTRTLKSDPSPLLLAFAEDMRCCGDIGLLADIANFCISEGCGNQFAVLRIRVKRAYFVVNGDLHFVEHKGREHTRREGEKSKICEKQQQLKKSLEIFV